MGRVAQFGVYVEIVGTLGIAIILAIHGFHHGLGFLFSTENVQNAASNPSTARLRRQLADRRALIAVLAPVYIFYGFESAGDISEETKDAGRKVPGDALALIWGGIASFILIAALLLAMPEQDPVKATVDGGGVPFILGQLSSGLQDFLLLLIIFAFFSCGTPSRARAAGWRSPTRATARSRGRGGSPRCTRGSGPRSTRCSPARSSRRCSSCSSTTRRPRTSTSGSSPTRPTSTAWSRSCRSASAASTCRSCSRSSRRSWPARAAGSRRALPLGRWGWTVYVVAAAYLGLMLVNIVAPTGLTSPRALLQPRLDHAGRHGRHRGGRRHLLPVARPDRNVGGHVHDELEPTGAERHG